MKSYKCVNLERRVEASDKAHAKILLQCPRCYNRYCPGPVTVRKAAAESRSEVSA